MTRPEAKQAIIEALKNPRTHSIDNWSEQILEALDPALHFDQVLEGRDSVLTGAAYFKR